MPGKSRSYQQAYLFGCMDGESAAGNPRTVQRNDRRYAGDPDYAAGWDDGQKACYEAFMRTPRTWKDTGR